MHNPLVYKNFLDKIYIKLTNRNYLGTDPLSLVYKKDGNKEFIAFVTALFSYGKVNNIINFLNALFDKIGTNPFKLHIDSIDLYYRFQKSRDINILLNLIKIIYKEAGSIENFLIKFSNNLDEAYYKFSLYVYNFGNINNAGTGFYFLFPIDEIVVSKRINLFLRWMVRTDDVDLGLWKHFDKKELKIPLDTHMLDFSIANKIISNKQNNKKNVIKVTNFFKYINADDPLKYDFAITRLGMLYNCKYTKKTTCIYTPKNFQFFGGPNNCHFFPDCPFL